MKKGLISSAVIASLLLIFGAAFAADEQKEVDIDEVIAKCEDKYTSEAVADENERNKLIDECVEKEMKGHEGAKSGTD